MGVQWRALGQVEAHVHGRQVELGHARQRTVLAVLLVEAGRVVPPDTLVDRVWGERLPSNPRGALYGYLHRLRRVLPERTIQHRAGGYLLAIDPLTVDLHRFTSLARQARSASNARDAVTMIDEALGLWRDTAFVGLSTPWLDDVRADLERQRLAAELDRVDLALAENTGGDLLVRVSALAREHPLDERIAAQLMLVLHRDGRQADALRHYLTIRARLADEFGSEPGALLQEAHRRVLDQPAATPAAEGASLPVRQAVPRQLPAPPWPFVGRNEHLADLDKVLANGGDAVMVTAIVGIGGIGKTWLALQWAHRRLDHFPDGQLYVDLRGFDPVTQPTAPSLALRRLLDALGGAVDDTGDVDTLAARYRSLVADKRFLIVLDNARDAAQVVPLLPGSPTCAVVITSRDRLPELVTGHGARSVALPTFTGSEAAELFAMHLGRERVAASPAAVDAILDHCAGLPMALAIAAAHATTHPHLPLVVLADEIGDDPLDSLRAVFTASYQALSAPVARVFRLVGSAPGPNIDQQAAAVLTGLPPRELRSALRHLESMHLVERISATRYAMHDLLRRYATELDTDVEAVQRLVDCYVETAHAADRLLDPYGTPVPEPGRSSALPLATEQEATAWLEAEHACLLAAQAWAVERGDHTAIWHLAWSLETFHWRRGLLDDQLAAWRPAVAAARHLDDTRTALAHSRTGHALLRSGDLDGALEHLHRAFDAHGRVGARLDQAHVRHAIAAAHGQRGDFTEAVAHAEDALRRFRDIGADVWEANTLNTVGWFLGRLGEHDRAREHCAQAAALCRRLGYREGEAAARDSLGYLAHTTGAHHRALGHYRHALRLRRDLGETYEEADALVWIGKVHAAINHHTDARTAWNQARALYVAQGREPLATTVEALIRDLPLPGLF
ncbi:BTAD domain-containing putative transcriptional regulator [Actinosynnema sp. NPDC051121]